MTKEKRVLFLIGNVMPDFVRLLYLISSAINFQSFTTLIAVPLNNGSHSLLGVLAYAVFISIFFEPSLAFKQSSFKVIKPGHGPAIVRKWQAATEIPLFLLVIGGVAHLFLDTFMWPFGGGIYWLYPLNGAEFLWSFKAWWPSSPDAIIFLAPFFVVALIAELVMALIGKSKARKHALLN